ncbi:MAG: hypothetical protein L3J06_06130 [Cyclobacteriaceae bacterium]|nr:hypothetical protein [Cyclobacteriaceae bacterium]
MKALVIQSDLSFKIQDKDKPTPKEGEALVKLLAASLNRQWIREGKYPSIIKQEKTIFDLMGGKAKSEI